MYEDVLEFLTQVLERHSARVLPTARLLKLLLPIIISAGMSERGGAGWRRLSFIEQTTEHKPDTAITVDACIWTDFDRRGQVDSKSALNSNAASSHLQSCHGLSPNLVHLSDSYKYNHQHSASSIAGFV